MCVCVCACSLVGGESEEFIAIASEIVILLTFLFSKTKKGGITVWRPYIVIIIACCQLACCCKVLVLMCLWDIKSRINS